MVKIMNSANLEHVNFTVSDPEKTARLMCELFGWHVRWHGPSLDNGRTVHVGNGKAYLALYSPRVTTEDGKKSYARRGGLNHVGVVVDDIREVEERVIAAGLKPHSHDDYDPGVRFYFDDHDGIEYEVVSYA